jgi:drug/metabolite transporter (DMT)-like permease
MTQPHKRNGGTVAALLTPLLMGTAPIFGKLAIRSGMDPYTLAAIRTLAAAALLWIVYALFFRRYIYIFPAGLLATVAVGLVNGLGSLLYYNGLLLLDDASLAQLLNMLYVVFVMLLTRIYGGHISRLSLVRAILAVFAVYLLAAFDREAYGTVHWLGVGLMIGGAFLYAYHVVLSQRGMYEMPAPTMALYALTWMAASVLVARLALGGISGAGWLPVQPMGWWFVVGLTMVTALSRVTLFAGVRNLGAISTILLNVAEIAVTLIVAFAWLGEMLAPMQWVGVLVLLASVVLSRWDTQVRDTAYRPLLIPSPLGGLPLPEEPISPGRFSTISRLYRRRPRTDPGGRGGLAGSPSPLQESVLQYGAGEVTPPASPPSG